MSSTGNLIWEKRTVLTTNGKFSPQSLSNGKGSCEKHCIDPPHLAVAPSLLLYWLLCRVSGGCDLSSKADSRWGHEDDSATDPGATRNLEKQPTAPGPHLPGSCTAGRCGTPRRSSAGVCGTPWRACSWRCRRFADGCLQKMLIDVMTSWHAQLRRRECGQWRPEAHISSRRGHRPAPSPDRAASITGDVAWSRRPHGVPDGANRRPDPPRGLLHDRGGGELEESAGSQRGSSLIAGRSAGRCPLRRRSAANAWPVAKARRTAAVGRLPHLPFVRAPPQLRRRLGLSRVRPLNFVPSDAVSCAVRPRGSPRCWCSRAADMNFARKREQRLAAGLKMTTMCPTRVVQVYIAVEEWYECLHYLRICRVFSALHLLNLFSVDFFLISYLPFGGIAKWNRHRNSLIHYNVYSSCFIIIKQLLLIRAEIWNWRSFSQHLCTADKPEDIRRNLSETKCSCTFGVELSSVWSPFIRSRILRRLQEEGKLQGFRCLERRFTFIYPHKTLTIDFAKTWKLKTSSADTYILLP